MMRADKERWSLGRQPACRYLAAVATVGAALLVAGCGRRESAAPVGPQTSTVGSEVGAKAAGAAPASPKTGIDPIERLLRELAEARQPGIYFTLKKLEKPELQPHLTQAHADPQQRARISRAILKLAVDGDGTAAGVMRVWVIPEQVPALIEFMQSRGKFEKEFINALAEIKDPRSVEAIAKYFPRFRETVSRAFVKLGGELCGTAVLPYLHYPDAGLRNEARRLCGVFGVKPDAILDQTLRDLKADEPKRRFAACEWLLKADPKQPRRAEIARRSNRSSPTTRARSTEKPCRRCCGSPTPTASPVSSHTCSI